MFSEALSDGLSAIGSDVSVVRVADGSPGDSPRVTGELQNGSAASVAACSDLLNQSDVAVIHYEYGVYGGRDGSEVVDVMDGLRVPSIVVAHTVLKHPNRHQRSVMEAIAQRAQRMVVMSVVAQERLCDEFGVNRCDVSVIPYGTTLPAAGTVKRSGRPTLLTWGLLEPGHGIERVIDAMSSLRVLPGRPRYLIVGETHPKVLATQGDTYRESLFERAASLGVTDSVSFDTRQRSVASMAALAQVASAIVVPYDSTDQVSCGALADAVGSGRPVVSTAFPHAFELLSSGAGITVSHDNPAELTTVLRRVLTEPRLAGSMASAARAMAPHMSWSVVSQTFLTLAKSILSNRPTTSVR